MVPSTYCIVIMDRSEYNQEEPVGYCSVWFSRLLKTSSLHENVSGGVYCDVAGQPNSVLLHAKVTGQCK